MNQLSKFIALSTILFSTQHALTTTTSDTLKHDKHQSTGGSFLETDDSYKTCFHPYEGSFIYAEHNLVHFFTEKEASIQQLIDGGFIDHKGNILRTDEALKSLLKTFWSGDCGIVLEARKHRVAFRKDFNAFMDRVFENNYTPESDTDLDILRYQTNIISAIIDLSFRTVSR